MVLECVRQKVIEKYAPDEADVHMRALEVAQITDSNFFFPIVHDDIDEILKTIREDHRKDAVTADDTTPAQDSIKAYVTSVMKHQDEKTMILKQLCAQLQIPEGKITEEEYRAFRSMMEKSKLFKKQVSLRGKYVHAYKRRR